MSWEEEWRESGGISPWLLDKAGGITSAQTLCCAGVVVKPGPSGRRWILLVRVQVVSDREILSATVL